MDGTSVENEFDEDKEVVSENWSDVDFEVDIIGLEVELGKDNVVGVVDDDVVKVEHSDDSFLEAEDGVEIDIDIGNDDAVEDESEVIFDKLDVVDLEVMFEVEDSDAVAVFDKINGGDTVEANSIFAGNTSGESEFIPSKP